MITREVIDSCPNLKYIGLFATGFNNVDIEYARKKNIVVCNAGSYSTNAVAQQTFAYILDYCNKIRDYDIAVKNGEWEKFPSFSYFPIPTAELAGKTISIVGYGSIGRKVAKLANAFDMNVIVSTRTKPIDCPYEVTDIMTAVRKADILTFHCPLTEKTKGIVNAELLSEMKQTAILINTSRGAVVNEKDLADALNQKRIAGAYLDVLEKEPMSPDTPLKNARNCIYKNSCLFHFRKQFSIHDTFCFFGKRTMKCQYISLSDMKQTAILINTSRGAVVNEKDLADALNQKRIAGAYLDVLEKEPMSPDTPLKNARNCIITPHTSWASFETRSRLVKIVCDNIKAWQNGSPVNKVN